MGGSRQPSGTRIAAVCPAPNPAATTAASAYQATRTAATTYQATRTAATTAASTAASAYQATRTAATTVDGAAFLMAAATALVIAGVVRAGRTLGALPTEVVAPLPGDEVDIAAATVTTRAVRIAAPPAAVWPWLVQMGYRRGGWYAIDALERLVGAGDFLTGGSADRIVPELQELALGDRLALNERAHLLVAHLDAPRAMVLVLLSGPLHRVWSFTLHELLPPSPGAVGTTRLVVRCRTGARARWVRPVLPLLEVGHLVMERVQLQRLRRRVEASTGA